MNKVNEMFGLYTGGRILPDLTDALTQQRCPFTGRACYKTRKSAPDIAIGTCSLNFDNIEQPILICPEPLTKNGKAFTDCLQFIAPAIAGSDLYLIPEVNTSVGRIDYVLAAFRSNQLLDFVPIELQALDTTGSIWNERQKLLIENGYAVDAGESRSSGASLNWKMTAKTILAQLVQKSQLFASMNKKLVLVCQKLLYDYMARNFNFSGVREAHLTDVLHFHTYDYLCVDSNMKLILSDMLSASLEAVERIMGSEFDSNSEYYKICEILTRRRSNQYRFSPLIQRS